MPLRICFALLLLFSVFPSAAGWAAKGNNSKEEQQEREREQKAEREVKAAREKAGAAQKALAAAQQAGKQAQAARDSALKRIKEVRERLEDKHQSASGLAAARERQAAAKKELEQIQTPLLDSLRASVEYKTAKETADAAKREVAAGGANDSRMQELKEQFLRVGQLERATIDNHPQAKAAKEKMVKADEAVAAALKKLEQMVDSDSELQTAKREFEKTDKVFDEAKRKYAGEQRDLVAANNKVQQEIAQLNQIKRANQLDDQRDKQAQQAKNNKGKKKK